MAEVSLAECAGHLGARHAKAVVRRFDDILLGNRLPEARPASARVELGVGQVQSVVAADAAVETCGMVVPVGAGKGLLGALLAGDFEGERAEELLPLGLALDHLLDLFLTDALAEVGEALDRDGAGLDHDRLALGGAGDARKEAGARYPEEGRGEKKLAA